MRAIAWSEGPNLGRVVEWYLNVRLAHDPLQSEEFEWSREWPIITHVCPVPRSRDVLRRQK